jgi:hypothetical protein
MLKLIKTARKNEIRFIQFRKFNSFLFYLIIFFKNNLYHIKNIHAF